ncbi:enoyl-CoA delta isomerase 1 peroxisomal [Prunus yedoensis var. nudiflora]|uniref:Delta(3)-Delta(2)-enoyl-CoA isomerase n=1 Tax=Prunus yedoensis var. nudiflora TaxID=2094558 RepID=A0A315AMU2_PRUYE|nr:enoyl-CoA delta isomerase 1 peroxisomal [Prunus yedoensis var. nudiflora]
MCTLERKGNIFILTLTGPGEHRLNPTLIDSIQSALTQVRAAVTTTSASSSPAALITTAHGKFFSNGYDLSWAQSSQSRTYLMDAKLRSLVSDFISLPVPTIAAVSGHASAAGFILALSHDHLLMRRDRGFIYMSELDIELILPAWFLALIESKVGSPRARRDLLLRADKVTADVAVKKGIIDSAHDSAKETVEAAVRLGEELVGRNWNGHVYAQIRVDLLSEVLDEIRRDNGTGMRSKL